MQVKTLDERMIDVARILQNAADEWLDGNDTECRTDLRSARFRIQQILDDL